MNLISKLKDNSLLEQVEEKINNTYNIAQPSHVEAVPEFPEDITELTDEDVGRYLASYDSEVAYIRYLLSRAEVKFKYGKYILETFRKQLYALARAGNVTQRDAQSLVDNNPQLMEAEMELMEIDAEKMLLDSRMDIFTRYSKLMSREITRRKKDIFMFPDRDDKPSKTKQQERIDKISGKMLQVEKPKDKD